MNSESRELSGEYRCTTIIRSGEAFCPCTPILRTSAGSRGCAMATRFCTCTWAMSRLVPSSKLTWIEKRPSAVDCEYMYNMFSTPLICCSIGVTTVEATPSALAPGYWPVTLIVGGAISGYCSTASRENDTPPRITKTIETTAAKIGRSMKKCERRMASVGLRLIGRLVGRRRGRALLLFRRDLHSRARAHQPVDDHAVGGGETVPDHPQAVFELRRGDVSLPGDAAIVDDQHIFARLLGADRRVGNEERGMRRRAGDTDAAEHAGREDAAGIVEHRAAADGAR